MKKIFSSIDNRLLKTMIISLGIIFILFIMIIVISSCSNRFSYASLEEKIVVAAKNYYDDHSKELPTVDGNEIKIDVEKLVKKDYIKSLDKYSKKEKCTAEVGVTLNGESYIYTPYLKCDNYATVTLKDKIMENEEIISNNASIKNGLYSYGNTLIYRGEDVNNYLSFGGQLWRILRINEDGTIRLMQVDSFGSSVWDNRYNVESEEYTGYNEFEKSRLKQNLIDIANGEYGDVVSELEEQYLVRKSICLDAKDKNSFNMNGIITCNNATEEKYLYTLLDISEYFIASLDLNCNQINARSCDNYNYMTKYNSYWTVNAHSENSYEVFYVSGGTYVDNASEEKELRLVTHLLGNSLYKTGDGTKENPYTLKMD